MKYINTTTMEEVEFQIGDLVEYNGIQGIVIDEKSVELSNGAGITRNLRSETHRFVNLSRPLEEKSKH